MDLAICSTFPADRLKYIVSAASLTAGLLFAQSVCATTVQFQTVMGDFEVNLFDKTAPKTVENFLTYVKENAYQNTVVHRSEPGFVVQGGGYKSMGEWPLVDIPTRAAVANEPVYSNVRGTIAMAKLGNNPDSATNQWFINLDDKNAANLDLQNGGFTVFGQVTGNGMAILDAIATLDRFNASNSFRQLPLRNYSEQDSKDKVAITDANFVLVQNIVVLNADPDTAANLTPVKNTLIIAEDKKDGGGGSVAMLSLLMLGLLALGRKRLLNRG